ncbi:sugar phosphate isomerase/epimerase family protein [Cohaesibacter celericrescens]|uniref:sugar phosphate isomerase/epimerase family protein n=1 Tax=Cohaesibacter celericrescens TaxID=2067669 RepID=UPI003566E671
MTLGLGTYMFRWSIGHKDLVPDKPLTPMDILTIADTHGFKVVQYADNMPLETLSDEALQILYKTSCDKGIALELGTESFDADEVARNIDLAGRIDAKILRIALDTKDAAKPVSELAAEFTELLPQAKENGVRLAIENHFNFPSRRLVELLDVIADDSLGVCLDVANSICAGEWPMETVGILAPFTINLHLKDYVIIPDAYGVGFRIYGCPLGTGKLDIDAVMKALQHCPGDMSVILEHWLPKTNDDLVAARAKEHEWLAAHIKAAKESVPSKWL